MLRYFQLLLLSLAALLSACATQPAGAPSSNDSTPSTASEAAEDERMAPPVQIPAASAKRMVLTMTGPANVTGSSDWEEFKREWRETFSDHAREAGIDYSFVDTPPAAGSQDGTLLTVTVADYRNMGVGRRMLLGALAGNAYIDARISYTDLRAGTAFGEQQYNTSSTAWAGVFSRVTPQQVDQIATSVLLDFKAAH